MNIFLLIILTSVFASYSLLGAERCPTGTVFNSFSKEVRASEGFEVCGTGCAMPTGKLRAIFMAFESCRQISIADARKLYIKTVEGLQNNANNNLAIRPFMEIYPFTWKNIDASLSFVDVEGNRPQDGQLVYVERIDENLCFAKASKTGSLSTIHKEPFEDSLKIVRGELPDPYLQQNNPSN